MAATPFEYRFRFAIHAVVYALGFWCPWVLWGNIFQLTDKSTWLTLASFLWRHQLLSVDAASILVLALAALFAGLGAWLRTWGSAYIGSSIVASGSIHGDALLADGPFRHTRNPLYLGTLLHTIGLSILMPPSGAAFTIILIWIFQIRLALAEEPFLTAQFGQPYKDYAARVPRFLPMIRAQVPASGAQPHWLQAIFGELYFILAFVVIATCGWGFNANPLRQGILISLGLWLVARALLPRARQIPDTRTE